jgi:hypothetical protein
MTKVKGSCAGVAKHQSKVCWSSISQTGQKEIQKSKLSCMYLDFEACTTQYIYNVHISDIIGIQKHNSIGSNLVG